MTTSASVAPPGSSSSETAPWLGLGAGAESARREPAGGFPTAVGQVVRSIFHCDRPWVAATSIREPGWKLRSNTVWIGIHVGDPADRQRGRDVDPAGAAIRGAPYVPVVGSGVVRARA